MMPRKEDFDSFYREYAGRLFATAYRMVRNQQDALDIVQESFLRAYNARDRFEGRSRVSTWMYRIVANLSYDMLRRRAREKRAEEPERFDPPGETYDGERAVRKSEMLAHVEEAIATLTPRQKLIFVLKTYQELSYPEIAEITRSRVGTIKATYAQSVEKLRRELRRKGVMPS